MKTIFRRWLDKSKRRIQRRLDKTKNTTTFRPRFRVNRIEYEISQRTAPSAAAALAPFMGWCSSWVWPTPLIGVYAY